MGTVRTAAVQSMAVEARENLQHNIDHMTFGSGHRLVASFAIFSYITRMNTTKVMVCTSQVGRRGGEATARMT